MGYNSLYIYQNHSSNTYQHHRLHLLPQPNFKLSFYFLVPFLQHVHWFLAVEDPFWFWYYFSNLLWHWPVKRWWKSQTHSPLVSDVLICQRCCLNSRTSMEIMHCLFKRPPQLPQGNHWMVAALPASVSVVWVLNNTIKCNCSCTMPFILKHPTALCVAVRWLLKKWMLEDLSGLLKARVERRAISRNLNLKELGGSKSVSQLSCM